MTLVSSDFEGENIYYTDQPNVTSFWGGFSNYNNVVIRYETLVGLS